MKKNILLLLAAASLVACSNDDTIPVSGETTQIMLNSNTIESSATSTRAPFVGAIGATNKLKARVIASENTAFTGDTYADGTMTFAGTVASYDAGFDGESTYPDANASVYLFGLYPDAAWTYTAGKAGYTFTGKEDVMATEKRETAQSDATASNYKTLSFNHLLTKLEVKMNATSAAIDAFGNITAIKLVADDTGTGNVNDKVEVNNTGATMTTTFSSSAVKALSFYGLTETGGVKTYAETAVTNYALTAASQYVAYSMVAPANAAVGETAEYYLQINTAGEGAKYIGIDLKKADGTAFTGSTAGRSFGISLYFKSIDEIIADVEVIDWIDEGFFDGEITNE